ncbi:MAG: AAA-like domain-containing protein [Cyanobacteria bacterium SBLK]|nr:AAA-like domain-containing protein [Cyanobacteria bacterium SBLK]
MTSVKTILILTANPTNTQSLRLSEEVREVRAAWERSRQRDRFAIEVETAVRPRELRRSLLARKPDILHFSGHGGGERGLTLENDVGQAILVKPNALATLFRILRKSFSIQCVVLNACYSEVQANAIQPYVNYVVGMKQAIADRAARKFAIGFYDTLFAGESIENAFGLGCNAIEMENIPEQHIPVLKTKIEKSDRAAGKAKIFISYKRNVTPDETIALQLYEALKAEHDVFMDREMLVGMSWLDRIKEEIERSHFFIILLSEASIHSEMVKAEIEMAHQWTKERGGMPKILPVRLAYRDPFQPPLGSYLDPINWAFWQGEEDTLGLIAELQAAIAGRELALNTNSAKAGILQPPNPKNIPKPLPAAPLEMPEGTMEVESKFYIERSADRIALEAIARQGTTITIKGPRQMGKSSLLLRVMKTAEAAGKQVVFLDFQLFDRAALANADLFYREFCTALTDDLDLKDKREEFWRSALSNSRNCTRYFESYVLKAIERPTVLAMDEVESLFGSDFRSDFFAMLRGWHNSRAMKKRWKQLDLALVTSTEPYQLIADLNQSPFNVGEVLELTDFTGEQVTKLNRRHGLPLDGKAEKQLLEWVGGHPYLVRRALYLVAKGRLTAEELFREGTSDRGPFGDHLRYHLFRLCDREALVKCFLQIIRGGNCGSEHDFFRLRGAGLVRREGNKVRPRCRLYAEYFQKRLS